MDTYKKEHGDTLRMLVTKHFPESEQEPVLQHLTTHDFLSAEVCIVTIAERLMNNGTLSDEAGKQILSTIVIPQKEVTRIRAHAAQLCL